MTDAPSPTLVASSDFKTFPCFPPILRALFEASRASLLLLNEAG
jgi:hypothetical protein